MSGIPPITPAPISPYGKLSMHARCLTCDAKASPFVSKFAELQLASVLMCSTACSLGALNSQVLREQPSS